MAYNGQWMIAQDATNLKKKKMAYNNKNILFQYEFRFSVYKKCKMLTGQNMIKMVLIK